MSGISTPRIRAAHWRAAVTVLEKIWTGREPADTSLQAWFRDHREMGGRDRANVSTLVYGALRDAMRLRRIAGDAATAETVLAVHALASGALDEASLQLLAGDIAHTANAQLASFDARALSAAQVHNVPDAIWAAWQTQYGDTAAALADALNGEAPVDLRVNTLKATRESALAALTAAGLAAQPTPLSDWGLRLAKRAALPMLPLYRDGGIEPQDEGSQLLARMVDARPGERIADFCAGAGGKTLALGAMMGNEGELWALDISATRLARLGPRAQRAGVTIVQACRLPDEAWIAAQRQSFDAVLVDAPCSATGTWRRNPELRLRAIDFGMLARVQREILASAARLVRPGGRLIYATCSLLAAENDAVVDEFLAAHPGFRAQRPEGLAEAALDGVRLRLRPDRQGTDGFFASCLSRSLHSGTC